MAGILGSELLRGEHVYLDRVVREDLPALYAWRQDLDFLRHLSRQLAFPDTMEGIEGWYKWMQDENTPPNFAIRLLRPLSGNGTTAPMAGQIIGTAAFKDVRWQSRHSFFWIGIGDPAMRGKGYGADAVRILLRYAFLEMNLNCVGLEVMAYNTAAIASYRKVGFSEDGRVRAYMYRDGVYHDMYLMSMTRDEWSQKYGQGE